MENVVKLAPLARSVTKELVLSLVQVERISAARTVLIFKQTGLTVDNAAIPASLGRSAQVETVHFHVQAASIFAQASAWTSRPIVQAVENVVRFARTVRFVTLVSVS